MEKHKELYINVKTGEEENRDVNLELPPSPPPALGLDIKLLCDWLKELDEIATEYGRRIHAIFPIKEIDEWQEEQEELLEERRHADG